MSEFILDEILNDKISELTLFLGYNDDGKQEKEVIKDIRCYIDYQPKAKYMDDKFIMLNAACYIKGKIIDKSWKDGILTIDGNSYKILKVIEYKDPFSNEVIYTKIGVV